MVNKNEKYTMTIEDMGSEGEGIGRIDGFTVFVEGGVLGDVIQVLIVKVKKSYAYGKLINIITPSPIRIEPPCEIFSKCGGCSLQQISYEAQLIYKTNKVKNNLKRIGKLEDIQVFDTIGMAEPFHYRNKAQFPVREVNGETVIGFYAKRSHTVIPVKKCLIQHSINEEILFIVQNFMKENAIKPYDEINHKGLIRHVLTKVGYTTKEIMVCLVINGKKVSHSEKLVQALKQIEGMKSIVLNFNCERTNVILGDKVEVLWGDSYITDYIGAYKFEISTLSFFQVNPVQTKVLYAKALALANPTKDDVVVDAYCGIGTISIFLSKQVKKVYGIEIVSAAIEDANKNARLNNIDNIEFIEGEANKILKELCEEKHLIPDILIVDPPRKGCEPEMLDAIISASPKKIIYISCDSATLSRDLKILSENGYMVNEVHPVDCFSMTTHVECAVLITRRDR